MVADSVYLTAVQWQAMATGIDFTALTTLEQEALIERASRLAEAYCGLVEGGSWLVIAYENEQHDWRQTRRVYPYNRPLISIEAVRLRVGASTVANIPLSAIYKNVTANYAEVTSLALALGVSQDIMNLGLFQSVIEIDYTAGYETTPQRLKEAVATIASALVVSKTAFEEGTAGVISFAIGSYQVTLASPRPATGEPQGAGFANVLPDYAKWLLSPYKYTALR